MSPLRTLPALAAALALSACLSFGGKPPKQLFTLTPATGLTAASARSASTAQTLTVLVPNVPEELNTMRIPARVNGTQVSYLKDAQWVEMPNALFARLLSETIGATTGRVVLDPKQFTHDPGQRLTGVLQSFGLDAGAMEVVAVYDAVLARGETGVESRRFEARVPVAADDATSVAAGLNQAANQIAAEVATWVGGV